MLVESGAVAFNREGAEQFDETVAIAQLTGEEPDEFAERCLQRIASAERANHCFHAVILFTSKHHTPELASARRLIALGVAEHAESMRQLNELMVVTAPTAEPELRDELLDLVDDLLLCNERRPLSVRICFSEPQPQAELDSGVFWRLPDSERPGLHRGRTRSSS
jgi:hypothetical protein